MLYANHYQDEDLCTQESFSEDQILNLAIKEEQRISLARDDFTEEKENR